MEKAKPINCLDKISCYLGLKLGIPSLAFSLKQKEWKFLVQFYEMTGTDEMLYITNRLIEKGYDKRFFYSKHLFSICLYNEEFNYEDDLQKGIFLNYARDGIAIEFVAGRPGNCTQLLLLPFYQYSAELDAILEEFARTGTVASRLQR